MLVKSLPLSPKDMKTKECATAMVGILVFYSILCAWLLSCMLPRCLPQLEDGRILANFSNLTSGDKFFFGLATAPAHVEDALNDSWNAFARSAHSPVRAWHNVPIPDERLRFWTDPNVELELARDAGVTVFRLGIDWGRIVTDEPVSGLEQVVDNEAVVHYQWILKQVHAHGMRVMLTLFHHSLPIWSLKYGGWTDRRTINYFVDFVRFAEAKFGSYVDFWVTFNEPHIFVILTHCSGSWPPGVRPSVFSSLKCFTPFGDFGKAIRAISDAHIAAYQLLHDRNATAVVGVAHHAGVIKPYGLLDVPLAIFSKWLTQFHWINQIQNHLDFCGINYYGQEFLSAAGLFLAEKEEYSEAGRGVYPNGLFEVLDAFYDRYKIHHPKLRYIITENGIADDRDIIRRPYLIEHLLAVNAAVKKGIPVGQYQIIGNGLMVTAQSLVS